MSPFGAPRKRRTEKGRPERLADGLKPVVEALGGALESRDGAGKLEDAIDPGLARRTEVSYRDGELLVTAASPADATLLRYEEAALAGWARQAFGLEREPTVAVRVRRPGTRS